MMIMKKDVTKKIIASSCSITGKENKNAKKKCRKYTCEK